MLTNKVSLAYLTDLREANVSYIFAGATKLDLGITLDKLNRLSGIRRVRIDGGGTVNGSFLKAVLIAVNGGLGARDRSRTPHPSFPVSYTDCRVACIGTAFSIMLLYCLYHLGE